MSRNKKLRPINETRRSDGTLTSETAYRLLKRRGGLARAKQMRAEGFITLKQARENSVLVRTLKAKRRSTCDQCKAFSEKVLRMLEAKPSEPLSEADRKLLL
jgi:hypothetical protein